MSLLDELELESNSTDELESQSELDNEPSLPRDPPPGTRPSRRRQKPAAQRPTTPRKTAPTPRPKTTSTLAREVGEDISTLVEIIAAGWGMRDDCCAPVLAEQAQPLGQSIAAALARNPRLLEKFAMIDSASVIVQWVTIARALQPVVAAIYRNHGPGTRGRHEADLDDDEGQGGGHVDLTAYPTFSGVPRAHAAG